MTDITGTLRRLWGARQKVWPMGKRRQRELERAMRIGQHGETSETERTSPELATTDRFFGLENYGNTCFCSSITQSLYFIDPFREAMLSYKEDGGLAVVVNGSKRRKRKRRRPTREKQDHLTMSLAELFAEISTQKHVTGSIAPAQFIAKLRESNAQYCTHRHQDAHEYLMFVVNHIIDQLKADRESHEKKEREAAGLRRQRRRSQQESPFTALTELASRFTAGLGGLSGTEEGNNDLDDDDEEEEEEEGHSLESVSGTDAETGAESKDIGATREDGVGDGSAKGAQVPVGSVVTTNDPTNGSGSTLSHSATAVTVDGADKANASNEDIVKSSRNSDSSLSGTGQAKQTTSSHAGSGNSEIGKTSPVSMGRTGAAEVVTTPFPPSTTLSSSSTLGKEEASKSNGIEATSQTRRKAPSQSGGESGARVAQKEVIYNVPKGKTWVHGVFEGYISNETRCLCCDTVSLRKEDFLDLSLDIPLTGSNDGRGGRGSSINANNQDDAAGKPEPIAPADLELKELIENFMKPELMRGTEKYYCETCQSLQEARKRTVIKKLPIVLPLHLKRFKYIEQFQRHQKLLRPVFVPLELKLSDIVPSDCENGDRTYSLLSIVIHIGASSSNGHYVTIVRRAGRWILFDDNEVTLLNFAIMERIFGVFVNRPREYTTAEEDFEINPPPQILGRWRRKRRSTAHERQKSRERSSRRSRSEQDAHQSSTGASSGEDESGSGGRVGGALFSGVRADADSANESAMEGDVDTEASEVESESEGGANGAHHGSLEGRNRGSAEGSEGQDGRTASDKATSEDRESENGGDSGSAPEPARKAPQEYEPDDLRSPVGYVLFYGDKELCSI